MTEFKKPEHLATTSPDQRQELLQRLKAAAPEAFAEGKLDLDTLKTLLGEAVETGPERFTFTWAGKRDAIAMLQAPTRATLIPDTAASVDFDAAQHVFIEGENLEVLKVLYRSYHGRVKLIYIDPPYNTGEDFVYPDNFNDPLDHYMRLTGQKSDDGDYASTKTDKAGRFHSSWLSMMYPRLSLARQLMREDGVILVSIDDIEVANLRQLMDEVFGSENFVAQIIWEGANKNDASQVGVCHEYVIAYSREKSKLKREWGVKKEGAELVLREVDRLKSLHGEDLEIASKELAGWFRAMKAKPCFAHRRFRYIDKRGVYKEDDPTAPGGRKFQLIDPRNGNEIPLRKNRGWGFDQAEFDRLVGEDRITFVTDTTIMVRRYLHETLTATPQSVFYQPARSASERLQKLMGANIFEFPKDELSLKMFVQMATEELEGAIVMDFFGGSNATFHATMLSNKDDGLKRQSVVVQMAEKITAGTETGDNAIKLGLGTIADVSRERARRVLASAEHKDDKAGLRCFKIAPSHITSWKGVDEKTPEELAKQLEVFQDTLVQGWKPEGVVWEAAIREGYSLTAKLEPFTGAKGGSFWRVTDAEKNQSFTISLDETLTLEAVRALDLKKEDLFISRATALDDTLAANLALQCRLKVL